MANKKKKPDIDFQKLGTNPLISIKDNFDFENMNFTSTIYFISDGQYVKIGITEDIDNRLKQLQTGNPNKLKLLFTIKGNVNLEKLLHLHFANKNKNNEWFDILDFLNIEFIQKFISSNISIVKLCEDNSSTKIYHDKDFRQIILNLSYNALRLCKFVEYQIKSGEDFIWINNTMFMKETNIRKLSIYQEAVEKLIRYGILSPTIYEGVYWTNSLIMFSGNRLRKYPENIKLR